ncbi:putative iron-regulated membrane protein [Azospirillum brasilense]|uniref:Putative iron-regulated membrane protein n=1 Tax=Azospirillum brasilense TaxID=192 RepID=A0A560CLG3_AZOBR|nr:PepSY-associated TM helix domain-containing protein [Azospirillum brasilense]TWA85703.1 putative iron-regulated membrane protein [Azospirillum brasilense]
MKDGFRQSMAWLHSWSGLLLGWLLFAVFLTGTIAYFRQEVTVWMQPELHGSIPDAGTAERAVERMSQLAPDAAQWTIALPGERSPAVSVSWRPADAKPNDRAALKRATLDAGTGAVLEPRETAGGNFLYRFHFELYGMPREIARWIVGIATMAMLVAIVSGIITHRRIFKDLFTFRPEKAALRSWMDGHVAAAVLALPFHLMITYSGLLLFMTMLMPWAVDLAYDGNRQAYFAESGFRRAPPPPRPAPQAAPLTPVAPLLAEADRRWADRGGVGSLTVTNPGRANATIELRPAESDSIGRGAATERLLFDGVTGRAQEVPAADPQPAAMATGNYLMGLHLARFAGPGMRWLFFVSGVAGTVMVGSGLIFWVVKRRSQRGRADTWGNGPEPFGHRLADRLNIGVVAGLPLAVAAYFWANRLLPAGLGERAGWEIEVFFLAWAAALLHAPLRPSRRGWAEQLWAGAALFALLPVLNLATAPGHLGNSLPAGNWLLAGFDLTALAVGLLLGFAARKVGRNAFAGKTVPAPVLPAGAVVEEPT